MPRRLAHNLVHSAIAALAICALAGPSGAEPIAGRGYFTQCLSDSCEIMMDGVYYYADGGEGTPTDIMIELYETDAGVQGVEFKGDYTLRPDGSASLALQEIRFVPDDPIATTLNFIQGQMRPMGEPTEFYIRIHGLLWEEYTPGEAAVTWYIRPGSACPDGTGLGGLVLSFVPWLSAPEKTGCWKIDSATEFEVILRDVSGTAPLLRLSRIGS